MTTTQGLVWRLLAVVLALAVSPPMMAAEGTDARAALAALIPETLIGMERKHLEVRRTATDMLHVEATFDDPDEPTVPDDLSVGITDLGSSSDGIMAMHDADAYYGRAQRQVEPNGVRIYRYGHPVAPRVVVLIDRMRITLVASGPLVGMEQLPEALAALGPTAVDKYAVDFEATETHFASTGLKQFLPDTLLGLERAEGYFGKVEFGGMPWGGWPYDGEIDGKRVRLRATLWDTGSHQAASHAGLIRLAEKSGWSSFAYRNWRGYLARGEVSSLYLPVGRFRLQVEAQGEGDPGPEALKAALDAIELPRIDFLSRGTVPPEVNHDPLFGLPSLLEPPALTAFLPEQAGNFSRQAVDARQRPAPRPDYGMSVAAGRYTGPAPLRLVLVDQGFIPPQVRAEVEGAERFEFHDQTVHLGESARVFVGGRLILGVMPEQQGVSVTREQAETLFGAVDLAGLERLAHSAAPVQPCQDRRCFETAFAVCQPAWFEVEQIAGGVKVRYDILGTVTAGCRVVQTYANNINPDWIGRTLVLTVDQGKSFKAALEAGVQGCIDGESRYQCGGSLLPLVRREEAEAGS